MNKPARGDGTVGKALEILDMVAGIGRPVRFTELLEQSDHPKATLYRFLQTLTNQNMLSYDPDTQTYTLGVRLVRLAHAAWAQSSLAPLARTYVDKLAQETGEIVHLAQMEGGQVLYVDKRTSNNPVELFSQAGKVGPGYCTGVGKAILAFLPQDAQERALSQQAFFVYTPNTLADADQLRAELSDIRSDGVAFDREEHEPGIICIAAPILSGGNRVIGAISVTSTRSRNTLETLTNYQPALLKTAQAIGNEAANWQFPTQN